MKTKIVFHHAKLLEPFFLADTLAQQSDYTEPSQEDYDRAMKENVEYWRSIEGDFNKTIHDVFGFNFERDIIDVYVVRGARRSMSKPLIVTFRSDREIFVSTLIHELLHVLFRENQYNPGFSEEENSVRTHIPVFAFLEKFYTEIKPNRNFVEKLKSKAKSPLYKRAWEIVNQKGYKNILNKK